MPNLNQVTTTSSRQVWQSPDGQRTLWEVVLDYQGKELKGKTYSQSIAQEGWVGDVEAYEQTGKNGTETFVRQQKKEGFTPGTQRQTPDSKAGGHAGYSKTSSDNYTMYLSYAKDIAVALLTEYNVKDDEGKKLYRNAFDTAIEAAIAGAGELYASRPDAPKKDLPSKEEIDEVFGEGAEGWPL